MLNKWETMEIVEVLPGKFELVDETGATLERSDDLEVLVMAHPDVFLSAELHAEIYG